MNFVNLVISNSCEYRLSPLKVKPKVSPRNAKGKLEILNDLEQKLPSISNKSSQRKSIKKKYDKYIRDSLRL